MENFRGEVDSEHEIRGLLDDGDRFMREERIEVAVENYRRALALLEASQLRDTT